MKTSITIHVSRATTPTQHAAALLGEAILQLRIAARAPELEQRSVQFNDVAALLASAVPLVETLGHGGGA